MIQSKYLSTRHVKMLVLDEADEMLSRGFKDQIYDVFQKLPPSVHVGLFSATMPADVLELTSKFMRDPIRILFASHGLGHFAGFVQPAEHAQGIGERLVIPGQG